MKRYVVDANKVFPPPPPTELGSMTLRSRRTKSTCRPGLHHGRGQGTVPPSRCLVCSLLSVCVSVQPKEREARTTLFKRRVETTYDLKIKASRALFGEVNRRFPNMVFSLRYAHALIGCVSNRCVARLLMRRMRAPALWSASSTTL